MPPTIIFDLDGTLIVESASLWEQTSTVAHLFGDSAHERQAVVTAFFACNDFVTTYLPERKHDIAFYLSYVGRSLGRPIASEQATAAAAAWSAVHQRAQAEPVLFTDVVPALTALTARGFRLVVASGGSEASRTAILCLTGIRDFFTSVYTGEGIGYQKQERAFWDEVVARIGWTPGAACIVVGNQINDDIIHPLALGLPAVLLQYPETLKKVSRQSDVVPTATFENLTEFLESPFATPQI